MTTRRTLRRHADAGCALICIVFIVWIALGGLF